MIPEHRLLRRRPERTGGLALRAAAGAARCGPSPTCAPATSSSTRTMGIARFAGFETQDGGRRSPATTSTSSTRATTACSSPPTSSRRSPATSGRAATHPPLSKLGGTRWDTMKARARRAAQEMAGELLNLYAERRRRAGYAFAPDDDWQREFEAASRYAETPDQREAIELVKADMEAPRPMDRLVCGDVGYGKTEVALRAAFKAASHGKQVLMLVPTTILAQQHFGHVHASGWPTTRSTSSTSRAFARPPSSGPRSPPSAWARSTS